jgi:cytochrome P450
MAAWTEITYKPMLLQIIARVSSRVFLGPELCANRDWLRISEEYAVDSFIAARALRQWPSYLRPVVHWFLPECRKLRATLNAARRIIKPFIERHREGNRKAREAGEPASKVADTIGWMDEAAKGQPYDVATAQLGLSFAAIHTTTEMVSGLISDLCANPEYFEPLRQEMASVLANKGWSKSALHEMKLVDSAMKESQRHHFGDIGKCLPVRFRVPGRADGARTKAAMQRVAQKPITLSDGTRIPKGAFTMVGIEKMQDTTIFPDPHKFMGRRFLEMRQQPGQENRWQFVTTSPEHLVFGHGKHACPGRFFASSEIKVVLVYLLMRYDWRFTPDGRRQDKAFGQQLDTDPAAKAMIRRRKQEVEI